MLSFRLILTTVAAGIALWGLFSLLDNLNEPGLLRSGDRAIVKGCDALDSEETQQRCPALICQKALFDSKSFAARSTLRVTADRASGAERLIAVSASQSNATPDEFVCVMQRERVLLSRRASAREIQDALDSPGGWLELLSVTMTP